MKNYKTALVAVLILFQLLGWYTFIKSVGRETFGIQSQISQAHAYVEAGLYQKAIDECGDILSIKEEKEVRLYQLEAYLLLYGQNGYSSLRREIVSAIDTFISMYPGAAEGYELAASFQYNQLKDMEKTIIFLRRAEAKDIQTEKLAGLWQAVEYAYKLKGARFSSVGEWFSLASAVESDTSYGYVTANGKTLLRNQYTYAGPLFNNLAMVKTADETLLIDGEGTAQVILDNRYLSAGIYNNGLLPVETKEGYAYIDATGAERHGGYSFAGTMLRGNAMVQKNGQWSVVDTAGNVVAQTEFEDVVLDFVGCYSQFASFPALKNGVYGLYSPETFEAVSSFTCESIDAFYADGIAAFEKNGKWGFVDAGGTVVIEPQYQAARSFSNGYAAVCKNGKWGFINTSNEPIVEYTFEDARYFNSSGTCWVDTGRGWDIFYFLVNEI